jgi:exodeoxyribonuclease V alpha subunit
VQAQKLPNAKFTQTVLHAWTPWQQALKALSAACTDAQAIELLTRYADFQVLCTLRNGPWGVDQVNRLITRLLGLGPEDWYVGRPVMLTRNDPNLKLMNGDVGLCLPTEAGLRVAFAQEGRVRWVLPSRLETVETVWAMTVHKSQGSEFEHVMLVLPDAVSPVMTRELLYTGITRAKNQLSLVLASQSVLLQATAARILRSGGLSEQNPEN